MSGPKKLSIYDFDWTLFRSPMPPPGVLRWWSVPASLCPPVMPKRPGDEWWIEEVVAEMRNDQKQGGTITGVMTGRRGVGVRARVRELLRQKRLRPDFIRFDDDVRGPGSIVAHKMHSLRKILSQNPTITELEVWEDNREQLDVFAQAARRRSLEYRPHLVTVIEQELA